MKQSADKNPPAPPRNVDEHESSQQYLRSANIAVQLATLLKKLGYDSRAVPDKYRPNQNMIEFCRVCTYVS